MTKLKILSSLKQRPWLLIPLLCVIPLLGILFISHPRQSPPQSGAGTRPAPTIKTIPALASPTPKPFLPAQKQINHQQPKPIQGQQAKVHRGGGVTHPATQKRIPIHPSYPKVWSDTTILPIDSVLEMRVALANGVDSLAVGTSTRGKVLDQKGHLLHELVSTNTYNAKSDGQAIHFASWKVPSTVCIEPTQGGYLYVGDRWYRGRVLLVAQGSSLLAVNYVSLKDYLYSVVGSEEPPYWPIEALKAQAIAARSYALSYYFKPASSLYHLGATEAYQVYGGVEKEADTTHQAVDSTLGEFLSHKGGVVESLYAASDDLVATAHGGIGMSQTGALKLAQQGYNYHHILSTYYPGTGVSRIELDQE